MDTLDMQQIGLFTAANTERVEREKDAAITVIIGNPPYNVGQKSENDNNRNRKYKVVDGRVHDTYARGSKATSTSKLDDAYVKFFRWAADRLDGRDGIVCFVSNNGFIDQTSFDGMRKHLVHDFDRIDHIDLHGNVRRNPESFREPPITCSAYKWASVSPLPSKKGTASRLRYYRVPEMWRKGQKLEFLIRREVAWNVVTPDSQNTWLVPEHADEYLGFLALTDLFGLWSLGVGRIAIALSMTGDRDNLASRVKRFVVDYNSEVHRHKADPHADWPDHVNWSRDLKLDVNRGRLAEFDEKKIVRSLYRPFSKRWLFFDSILNEEVYQWPKISGPVIVTSDIGWRAPVFNVLLTDVIAEKHLCATIDAHQCFPHSHLKDAAVVQFRQHYSNDSINKEDVFYYLYALLHHPDYRERYAANLKRELPRIPFAPDFAAFATAGKELARLHVEYESLDPWPLQEIETRGVPYSQRVLKMKLSPDKQSLHVNESLTLAGIPPETFEYRLGSRSALEWVIDQYQVKGESDPNREDNPGYIVRLVGQVVRVSVMTVQIVTSLPAYR